MAGSMTNGAMNPSKKVEPLPKEFDPKEIVSSVVPESVDAAEDGAEKSKDIVLGRNVHTICYTIKMFEVDYEVKQVSYEFVRDENGNLKLDCQAIEKQFAGEEVSAQVLRKLVDDASKFFLMTSHTHQQDTQQNMQNSNQNEQNSSQ